MVVRPWQYFKGAFAFLMAASQPPTGRSSSSAPSTIVRRADADMLAIEKSSYVDPNGYVFRTEQGRFPAIRPNVEPFYRGCSTRG